jgi:ricin-type beta-trefoil lectin protein
LEVLLIRKILAALATVVAAAIASVAVPSSPAQAQETPIRFYEIRGPGGKCLDVRNNGTANSTPVQLFSCNGTIAQVWQLWTDRAGNPQSWIAANSGKILDVAGGGTGNGSLVQIHELNGGSNQRWLGPNPFSGGPIVNAPNASGRCLDAPGGNTADGTQLQIYDCNGTAAQTWTARFLFCLHCSLAPSSPPPAGFRG